MFFTVTRHLTHITVISGWSTPCPSGYLRYHSNLNAGTGGDYVYLCYKYGVRLPNAITGLNVIASTSSSFPIQSGYTKVSVNLNKDVGSFRDQIYLLYTRSTSLPPIRSFIVIRGTTPYIYPSSTWVRIGTDCNQGAGGMYIYICYYQPRLWPSWCSSDSKCYLYCCIFVVFDSLVIAIFQLLALFTKPLLTFS